MATAESTQTHAYLLLLDWEKAFDKVYHHALFLSMERAQIDPHLIRLTQMLYAKPQFFTEIDSCSRATEVQRELTNSRRVHELSPVHD